MTHLTLLAYIRFQHTRRRCVFSLITKMANNHRDVNSDSTRARMFGMVRRPIPICSISAWKAQPIAWWVSRLSIKRRPRLDVHFFLVVEKGERDHVRQQRCPHNQRLCYQWGSLPPFSSSGAISTPRIPGRVFSPLPPTTILVPSLGDAPQNTHLVHRALCDVLSTKRLLLVLRVDGRAWTSTAPEVDYGDAQATDERGRRWGRRILIAIQRARKTGDGGGFAMCWRHRAAWWRYIDRVGSRKAWSRVIVLCCSCCRRDPHLLRHLITEAGLCCV